MREKPLRIFKSEVKYKRRLKIIPNKFYYFGLFDVMCERILNPHWHLFISSPIAYFLKNNTTNKFRTRSKCKWGKKGKIKYLNYSSETETRIKFKVRTKKYLDELGLKHFPTEIRRDLLY